MTEITYDKYEGHNYFKLYQHEANPAWGETFGQILRSVEFEDEGDGKGFAITMYTDHKGRSATPLTLSMTLRLPVEYLDDIVNTLCGIRARADQMRQAKAAWERAEAIAEQDLDDQAGIGY